MIRFDQVHSSGIRDQPADIEVRLTDQRSLQAVKAYILRRLCCPECGGTGRVADLPSRRPVE